MNSKDLTEKFWTLNEIHKFSSGTISMFFYLLYLQYTNKNSSFVLSDRILIKTLSINRHNIKPIREQLRGLNLVNFKLEAGKAPVYNLLNLNIDEFHYENEIKIINTNTKIKRKVNTSKRKTKSKISLTNVPSLEKVLEFVKELEGFEEGMIDWFSDKYMEWSKNGWANSMGRPITDYKATIKLSAPFYKNKNKVRIDLPTNENILK